MPFSRISHSELGALTFSSISTNIMADIKKTWENDANLKQLVADINRDASSHPNYSCVNDTLIRKSKVVVGHEPTLQRQLIELYHSSAVGGHSGATVTSKKLDKYFTGRSSRR